MAKCILSRERVETEDLPVLCMKCGEEPVTYVKKEFVHYPVWMFILFFLGILPFLIAMLLVKRMKVLIRLCDKHKRHFSSRSLFAGLGFLGLIAALTLSVITLQYYEALGQYLMMSVGIAFVIWFITICVQGETAIRASKVTANQIVFENVSDKYIAALGSMPEEDD